MRQHSSILLPRMTRESANTLLVLAKSPVVSVFSPSRLSYIVGLDGDAPSSWAAVCRSENPTSADPGRVDTKPLISRAAVVNSMKLGATKASSSNRPRTANITLTTRSIGTPQPATEFLYET
ncbi:hypothetical protein RSAG8_10129, partial [Rhizoctonia solani AG-8 WAC10335]